MSVNVNVNSKVIIDVLLFKTRDTQHKFNREKLTIQSPECVLYPKHIQQRRQREHLSVSD